MIFVNKQKKHRKTNRVLWSGNIMFGIAISQTNCSFMCPYRPEMDTEWTYIREPIETNSMVLKGLLPETQYQFVVRAVNVHGVSPPSHINNPVRTLGKADLCANVLRCDGQESLNSAPSLVWFQPHFKTKSVSTIHPHKTKQTLLIFLHNQTYPHNKTFIMFNHTV